MVTLEMTSFVESLAREAGESLMTSFRTSGGGEVTRPGPNIQTKADLESNELICGKLRQRFSDYEIKSEESLDKLDPFSWNYGSDFVWIVDPCDGTINYLSGVTFFSVSIALSRRGQLVYGVVYDPAAKELFSAEAGKGAYLNGRKIVVGTESALETATLGIDIAHSPELIRRELGILERLSDKVRVVRSFYSGALELCYLAAGRIDIRVDDSYKPWDVAAGSLIALEAGAVVSDLEGSPWNLSKRSLIAANQALHARTMRQLKE